MHSGEFVCVQDDKSFNGNSVLMMMHTSTWIRLKVILLLLFKL